MNEDKTNPGALGVLVLAEERLHALGDHVLAMKLRKVRSDLHELINAAVERDGCYPNADSHCDLCVVLAKFPYSKPSQ